MLIGEGGLPNLLLSVAGLVLIFAGVMAIRMRADIADYGRQMREQFFGELGRNAPAPAGRWPIVLGAILVILGLVGIYGGLFAVLPPPGTPRV